MITWRSRSAVPLLTLLLCLSARTQDREVKANEAHVFGVFVDANGHPIAGVEFLSRVYPGAEFPTTSAADGRFESRVEWDARKEGTWYEGIARGLGYAKWQTRADLKANDRLDLGKIELDPGGAVSGCVLDQTGKPLANALLWVIDATHSARPDPFEKKVESNQEKPFDSGKTKDDGTFRLIGLPPGRYWIIAKHETTWRDATAPVEVGAGKEVPVGELRLDPLPDEYRIEGTVLGPDEKPVAMVEVSTSVISERTGRSFGAKATTDAQGRFVLHLPQMPDSPVDLRAHGKDDRFDEGSLNSVRPGSRDQVIRLGSMRELHMLVLGPSGKPVESYGWFVEVDRNGMSSRSGVLPNTHASGCATIRVPAFPIEIEVDAPGFNRKKVGNLGSGALPNVVEVRLDAPAGVEGNVLYNGGPVPDCYVELVAPDPDHLNGVLGEQRSGLYYGWKGTNSRSDALGHFLIPSDFPHMTYYVRAWKEGLAEGVAGSTKVGGAPVTVELGDGGSIEGDIRLPLGKSPSGLVAEVYRKERKSIGDLENHVGTEFSAPVGEDGKFKLKHLAPGPWLLHLRVPGTLATDLGWSAERVDEYAKIPFVIQVEQGVTTHSSLDLTLDDACRLEGHLHVGNMIQEGYCTLELDGPLSLRASFGGIDRSGDKAFHLAVRTPGRYRLVIQAGPGHHQYKTITDLVDLKPGMNVWEKNLPESQWDGKGIRLDAH
jgi:hypothetical protein